MLKLSKNNTPVYDYFSEGDGSDPVSVTGSVNGAGGTLDSSVVTMYLVATTFRYIGITLSVTGEQTGIDWKLSLDNAVFADTRTPADMNALGGDQVIVVYAKAVITNDGSGNQPITGVYAVPNIQISATEQPV